LGLFVRVADMPARVDMERCNGCESCVEECPSDAVSIAENKAAIDVDVCVECGVCVDACPEQAISME
jgi:heterodisulfide reductase subunit A-like polyferredoxin